MKFKVREGFVVKLIKMVDLGDGTMERQETNVFPNQNVELSTEDAELHAHKLEPMDKAASAFLDAKVLPVSSATSVGVTPEVLAVASAIAEAIVAKFVAAGTTGGTAATAATPAA